MEQKENTERSESRERTMGADKKSAWLKKLDEECPYQVVLPRQQLADDSDIMDFLISYVGKFDMYVEDDYAAFVRYCFEDPLDAEIFRSRFEPKVERFKLAGGFPILGRPENDDALAHQTATELCVPGQFSSGAL